jgi:hypothetical protein
MVPDGMSSEVHGFEAREGGTFRPTGSGKTSAQTDGYHDRFVRLVPDRQVVEVVENELGWRMSLAKLAALVETADQGPWS